MSFFYFVHMYFPFDSILFNSAHNTSACAHMPYTHSIWEMESKRTERTIITANDTRRRRRLKWNEREKRGKKTHGKSQLCAFHSSFAWLVMLGFVCYDECEMRDKWYNAIGNLKCHYYDYCQQREWCSSCVRVPRAFGFGWVCVCASQTKGSINWNVSIHFRFFLLLPLPLLLLMLFLSVPLCTGAVLAIKPIEKSVTPLVTSMKFICGQWRRINLLNRPLNWPINDFYAIQLIYYIL